MYRFLKGSKAKEGGLWQHRWQENGGNKNVAYKLILFCQYSQYYEMGGYGTCWV
jgi:hypothetical protein